MHDAEQSTAPTDLRSFARSLGLPGPHCAECGDTHRSSTTCHAGDATLWCHRCSAGTTAVDLVVAVEGLDRWSATARVRELAPTMVASIAVDPHPNRLQLTQLATWVAASTTESRAVGARTYARRRGIDVGVTAAVTVGTLDGGSTESGNEQSVLEPHVVSGVLHRRWGRAAENPGVVYETSSTWASRLVVVARDATGEPIGAWGRALERAEPRYIAAHVEADRVVSHLRADGDLPLVIVEGILDWVIVVQSNYPAVCTAGPLTRGRAAALGKILRQWAGPVVVMPDADAPGDDVGCDIARLALASRCSVTIAWPDVGKDVGEAVEIAVASADDADTLDLIRRSVIDAIVAAAMPPAALWSRIVARSGTVVAVTEALRGAAGGLLAAMPITDRDLALAEAREHVDATETVLRAWSRSVRSWGAGHSEFPLTDAGNAERFRESRKGVSRYTQSGWWHWSAASGTWQHDPHGEVAVVHALEVVRGISADAASDAIAWSRSSEAAPRLRACVTVAQGDAAMRGDDADWDPRADLLCDSSGYVVNMRDGQQRRARASDLITRSAGTWYGPTSSCPTFERLVAWICESDAVRADYVQRVLGYAASGEVTEDKIFVACGGGDNGKSTLLDAVSAALGGLAGQVADGLLVGREGKEQHPTAIASLRGLRLAELAETEQGDVLSAKTLKRLTSRQSMQARFMGRDFFEFRPTHKILIHTNHRPRVKTSDRGTWRRLVLLPFERTITAGEKDKALPQKLRAELPGILRWLVDGARAWYQRDLDTDVPKAVSDAAADYRQSEDRVAQWLDERCELGGGATTTTRALYDDYVTWVDGRRERPPGYTAFARELTSHGVLATKEAGARVRVGIKLSDEFGFDEKSSKGRPSPLPSPRGDDDLLAMMLD